MKVMKFGGTSVGSIEGILQVKRIVESVNEPVVVVVSATNTTTDTLISMTEDAHQGKDIQAVFEALRKRHMDIIQAVVPQSKLISTQTEIQALLDELWTLYQNLSEEKNLSQQTKDLIVSYGERISSRILCQVIDKAVYAYAPDFIKTIGSFDKHSPDIDLSTKLIKKHFPKLPAVTLCPGFIASDKDTGLITNLGRGGSDYTASLIAAALQADVLEIWTDVDGFMTADPRVISKSYVIEKLSYVEAMELCNFGAKVIYPPTIYPAYHQNIPIYIKNTFNLHAQGTYISRDKTMSTEPVKGISSINDTALVTMVGLGMVGVIGISKRVFGALANVGISTFFISQAASENTISVGVTNDEADLAVKVISEEFEHELAVGEINSVCAEKNLATIAVVGDNMKRIPGISGKLFGALGRSGINVIAIAQGGSETNISFVIESAVLRKTLNVLHEVFFLSEFQELNIFLIGIGTVGGGLLDQIMLQQPKLQKQNNIKIKVVGVADEFKVLFNRDGITLRNYRELLATEGVDSTPEVILKGVLEMNIFNAVFVDCTASRKIAGLYKELLLHNISVVAANKITASGDYDTYIELKDIARKRGIKFLFETNVGAGLPVINTMNNLVNSGDKILKLEAVLSGTLNFIFNTISADIPLSKAIVMAKEARYSEPDPRIDLSGMDVIRKLVILTREAGYKVEQEDVKKNLFVPQKYFEGTLDDFWNSIHELDAEFELTRKRLEADNKRCRFVATMENGECSVGLQEVDMHHPFYELEGSNNIIMIKTERYYDYPMIIKGYGAGASVTAAGVFADIMSVANIR